MKAHPEPSAVVILSSPEDLHAQRVCEELRSKSISCHILDVAREANHFALSPHRELVVDDVCIGPPTVVWSRRPAARVVDPRVVDARMVRFVQQEWRHALHGGLLAVGCRVVNDPRQEYRAQFKPWQLTVAAKAGFPVPETAVTNSAAEAEAFRRRMAAQGSRTVFKSLTPLPWFHLGETREFTADVATGEVLGLAPVIFQQCIEKGVDLRVFVAGQDVVSAEVRTEHTELIDWRLDPEVAYQATTLSSNEAATVRKVVAGLGLDTASVDLRREPDGTLYFFEANPSGQFLMLEKPLGVNVAGIFAQFLASCIHAG